MASVWIIGDGGGSSVEYSALSGEVIEFEYKGQLLFDKNKSHNISGWRVVLSKLVAEVGLDVDRGDGIHAFVHWLNEQAA